MLMNKDKVYAVIISFNPEFKCINNLIDNLKEQNIASVVVDNGTLDDVKAKQISTDCHLVRLETNVGIAKAQNEGIRYAKKLGAEYIIFFDQDSNITSNFVDSLLEDYTFAMKKCGGKVGSIGPVFTDSRYGFFYKVIKINKYGFRKKIDPQFKTEPFEVTLIISSGSLVPILVLDDVGGMDEHLFIDYVDTEWCLRAVSKGYKIYVATSARMAHAIGDKMVKLFMFNVPVHSPFRRYYRVRNAIIFSRMEHIPIAMKFRDNFFNIVHQTVLICTQPNKIEYIKSMIRAIKDGIQNK